MWAAAAYMTALPLMNNKYVCLCVCCMCEWRKDIQLGSQMVLGEDKVAAPRKWLGCYFLQGAKVTTVMNDKSSIICMHLFYGATE